MTHTHFLIRSKRKKEEERESRKGGGLTRARARGPSPNSRLFPLFSPKALYPSESERRKVRQRSRSQAFAALPNVTDASLQTFAEEVRRATGAGPEADIPVRWDQLLLLFRCILLRNPDGIPSALAVEPPQNTEARSPQTPNSSQASGLQPQSVPTRVIASR